MIIGSLVMAHFSLPEIKEMRAKLPPYWTSIDTASGLILPAGLALSGQSRLIYMALFRGCARPLEWHIKSRCKECLHITSPVQ